MQFLALGDPRLPLHSFFVPGRSYFAEVYVETWKLPVSGTDLSRLVARWRPFGELVVGTVVSGLELTIPELDDVRECDEDQ